MENLSVVTAPATEPVVLSDAKLYLKADHDDEDSLFDDFIVDARAQVERESGRQLITATYDWKISKWPIGQFPIVVPKPPLVSVGSIEYLDENEDEQTLSTDIYEVDIARHPGEIRLKFEQDWPTLRGHVDDITIQFTCGYGDQSAIPGQFKTWIYKLIQMRYRTAHPDTQPMHGEPWGLKAVRWGNRIPEIK